MAFKALFLAHAPDADFKKHRSVIETAKFKLFTVVVKSQDEAIEVAKNIYTQEEINAVLLCPGFTHKDVAELFQALDGNVAVNVSRGDGPSSRISHPVIQREFYGK